VRRNEEVWRRQEKHIHSADDEVAEDAMEGRREPLSDWKAIVVGVAVLSPPTPRARRCVALAGLLSRWAASAAVFLLSEFCF
jgi:hypothetical protein